MNKNIFRFKCRNVSQDVNHNSKKSFKLACIENWEKVKDSYNILINDTAWKKVKLESKVFPKKLTKKNFNEN